MSNRTYTKEQLDAALASMGVTDQTDVSRYGSGHINDTFKVETSSCSSRTSSASPGSSSRAA